MTDKQHIKEYFSKLAEEWNAMDNDRDRLNYLMNNKVFRVEYDESDVHFSITNYQYLNPEAAYHDVRSVIDDIHLKPFDRYLRSNAGVEMLLDILNINY